MKGLATCAALSGAAFCLVAASNRLTGAGLTVHEWGTFTSVADVDGGPAEWETLGCKNDLPHFVNDYGFRGFKFRVRGTVRMETPVLYFYSPKDLEASVKVSFPNGLITEWYPKAEYQVLNSQMAPLASNLNGISTYLAGQTGVIQWKSVKIQPGGAPAFPVEIAPSRYYEARATDAAALSVGDQHEKFLFYRGVARVPVPLSARVGENGRIAVRNTGAGAVPTVILFENRGGAIGYRNAGAVQSDVTLERPALDGSASQIKADLEGALIAQGLYPKEAAAMIDTWRDSWFEEGSRLIYILPEAAVNAMLPLEIAPTPARVTRVFVGRIELITPETKRAVGEAIAKRDRHMLALYQRFLEPIGKRIGETPNFPCESTDAR
jgi:hypothetical protein